MKQETLKSLTKALDILYLFLDQKRELGLTEICDLTGLNKTTVSRIVSTLKKRGFISQREKRGKYFLGTVYLNFSTLVKSKLQIRNIAGPYLVKLGQEVNEAVVLTSGDGVGFFNETFYESVHSKNSLKVIPHEGIGFPQGTAAGKILLAGMSDEEMKTYFDNHKKELQTSYKVSNYAELKKQVTVVKENGVAFDNEEQNPGINGISAGIKNSEGLSIGAISIAAPAVRLSRSKIRSMAPLVKNTALEISKALGYIEE
jgi:IclR family transcriptional regulator, KDG regulon repressor